MKFVLIDKIQEIQPGRKIVTRKQLTLAEEYLGDHFPTFPVIPGVLMIEGMVQSAAWLVRLQQNYAKSVIVLKAARNVKYSYFLQPGNTIRYEVEAIKIEDDSAKFKGVGYVGDRLAVSARLELKCINLADKGTWGKNADRQIIDQIKKTFDLLSGPDVLAGIDE
ncbi:MAG: beta-hydroxyacyl-ACP dehydratase [Phycisphaerae bacterium]|nr:beta-hydroxyacyl-ACP dehydratase [Phycisphaerae bacterium]